MTLLMSEEEKQEEDLYEEGQHPRPHSTAPSVGRNQIVNFRSNRILSQYNMDVKINILLRLRYKAATI